VTVAAVTVPSGRSLLGKVAASLSARRHARGAGPSAAAAFLAKARAHLTTVAALAAFDLGAFQLNIPHCGSAPGLAAVCVSLLLLNFAVEG
jgi:hypothetical protein